MITTITLELVRHGPLHNQLLSPLTPYIALAGNRPAETVHVPVEHSQMIAHLCRLRGPQSSSEDNGLRIPERNLATANYLANADLQDASRIVTTFIESVRGLSEAISEAIAVRQNDPTCDTGADSGSSVRGTNLDGVVHLRLVISANELALLPFELAQGPLHLGGSDMLSAIRPPTVVITRDSRRFSPQQLEFDAPENYSVLVVAADPQRCGLPLDACLLALRRAFPLELAEPRVDSKDMFKEKVSVLADASLDAMRRRLASGQYTHVLILAHGRAPESLEGRPVVLFHSNNAAMEDEVSAEQLAATLRTPSSEDGTRHSRPQVVSLMICDSANETGSILSGAASIAHAVHEVGIPLVIGSQFSLTFAGAALLTEVLFYRLLHNQHPTAAIAEARQRLFTDLSNTNDWAALVTYATLPDDRTLQREVDEQELRAASTALNAAVYKLNRLVPKDCIEVPAHLKQPVLDRIDELTKRFERQLDILGVVTSSSSARRAISRDDMCPTYAHVASALANAYLWKALIQAWNDRLWKIIGEPSVGGSGAKREACVEVISALDSVLRFGHLCVEFGGSDTTVRHHIALAYQLRAQRAQAQLISVDDDSKQGIWRFSGHFRLIQSRSLERSRPKPAWGLAWV